MAKFQETDAKTNKGGNSGNRNDPALDDRKKSDNKRSRNSGRARSAGVDRNEKSNLNEAITGLAMYAKSPALLMDAASISWFRPLGTKLDMLQGAVAPGVPLTAAHNSVPGIAIFKTIPTPGWSDSLTSPVNVAAKNIYGKIRSTNSGAKVYEPSDYIMYIMAVDSAYSWIAWLRRLYKQLMVTSIYNRYLAKANVESEGVDYDDLISHISDFRYFINATQLRMATLNVPGDISYFRRHFIMFSTLYADADNQKAQIYKFIPGGYWKYIEYDGPGRLEWRAIGNTITFDDIKAFTNDMLNDLLASEDIGIMSGDTLKALGEGGLFTMEPLGEDEFIIPSYDPIALDEIQNLTIFPSDIYTVGNDDLRITQVADANSPIRGAVIFQPCFFDHTAKQYMPHVWGVDRVINVENPDPGPGQTMLATRLTCGAELRDDSASRYDITCAGTEIINYAGVIYLDDHGEPVTQKVLPTFTYVGWNTLQLYYALGMLMQYMPFDRHPGVYVLSNLNNLDLTGIACHSLELSNYTTVSMDVLRKIHEAAILSLFNVPLFGRN